MGIGTEWFVNNLIFNQVKIGIRGYLENSQIEKKELLRELLESKSNKHELILIKDK